MGVGLPLTKMTRKNFSSQDDSQYVYMYICFNMKI